MDKGELMRILDSVLPEFKKLSEAPTSLPEGVYYNDHPDLPEGSRMTDADWAWVLEERKKRYKTIDALGNVYLSMNPLVYPRKYVRASENGRWVMTVARPPRELVIKAGDGRRGQTPRQAEGALRHAV